MIIPAIIAAALLLGFIGYRIVRVGSRVPTARAIRRAYRKQRADLTRALDRDGKPSLRLVRP